MTLGAAGSAERWFDADSANVAGARQFVHDVAPPVVAGEADLLLSVSELVTNALLHGRSRFRVRVTTGDRTVRVEVFDANPLRPMAKNYGPAAATGRGLRIVEHLSSDWGVTLVDGGKWVWFEMDRPGPEDPPPAPAADTLPPTPATETLPPTPATQIVPPTPATAAEPPAQATVVLRDLPVAVHARAAAHQDALQREFDLLRHNSGPQDVPARLLALIDELDARYGSLNDRPTAELAAAIARGDDAVELSIEVPPDVAEALSRLSDLLDEADGYCRDGVALMTLATPAESRLYRRWLFGQFVDQIHGAAPAAWPAWLAAQGVEAPPAALPSPARRRPATDPAPGPGPTPVARPAGDLHARQAPGTRPTPVVRPAGDLDARQAPGVREELQALRHRGVAEATLDLTAVRFIDSFGISVILAAHTRFAQDGARLEVVVPPGLRPTFDVAGLDTVLHIRPGV